MNEQKAREILDGSITESNELRLKQIIEWQRNNRIAHLSGSFNADELEAIAWWMRNKGVKN